MTNDGAGLGNSYTYDDENRIIQVNGTAGNCSTATACYVYDAEGHRVRATVNGQMRDFIYDLSGRNIDEFTPGGSGWLGTWQRGEAYAGGLHLATYASGTTEFDNSDWLGTFRLRSGVTGARIESCTNLPFGEDLTCAGTEVTPLHFTGKERDSESGNDYFGARYYGSTMGRFLTADWAAKPTAVPYAHYGNPQSLNLYSYVQNNPTTVGDPDGHDGGGPDASWQTDPKAQANGVAQNQQPAPTNPDSSPKAPPTTDNKGNPIVPGVEGWKAGPGSAGGDRDTRWGPTQPVPADPSKGQGQPNASWDPNGHWDVKTGNKGETVRVLPDGTRVDHNNNPIPMSSSSGSGVVNFVREHPVAVGVGLVVVGGAAILLTGGGAGPAVGAFAFAF